MSVLEGYVHGDASTVVFLVLLVLALLAIGGGLWRLWLRDFVTGGVLVFVGVVLLIVA